MDENKVRRAESIAIAELDKLNALVGFVPEETSHYYQIQCLVVEAVHIGIQMAKKDLVDRTESGHIRCNKDYLYNT